MANWVGFSDDELRRMKQQTESSPRDARSQGNARPTHARPSGTRGRGAAQSQRRPQSATSKASILPPEARLSQTPSPTEVQHLKKVPTANKSMSQPKTELSPKSAETNDIPVQLKESDPTAIKEGENNQGTIRKNQDDNMGMVLDDKDVIIQELHNVEKFQFQQKRIEEQNKKKRQLLATAINERQKKAKQEATRLIQIQKELAQLDHLLAIDVSIIRNKIEESSREYTEAQRRYERAEKEFIESKMDLHTKSDQKDSLTEHLHLVIHQNEVRKARKLTELMEKLSMEDGSDCEQLSEEISATMPSSFIIGSLQSTAEQRAIMHRKRNQSESFPSLVSKADSSKVRSASDGGSESAISPTGTQSGGVGGWISSWIFGAGSGASPSHDAKTNSDSDESTFKAKLGSGVAEAVVTQALTDAKLPSPFVTKEQGGQVVMVNESQLTTTATRQPATQSKEAVLPQASQPESSTGSTNTTTTREETTVISTPDKAVSSNNDLLKDSTSTVETAVKTDVIKMTETKSIDAHKFEQNESIKESPNTGQNKELNINKEVELKDGNSTNNPTDLNDNKVNNGQVNTVVGQS